MVLMNDTMSMQLLRLGQMMFKTERYRGSVIVLVLIVLTMTMLEIAMLSLILTRSLGEEGVTVTQNQVARRGTETALTRITNNLYTYVSASGTTGVDAAFALGGSNAIENDALTATDPEDGSTDATNVTISAWLQERRGNYYHLVGKASYGDVTLEAHRWITVNPCTTTSSGGLSTIAFGVDALGEEAMAIDPSGTGRLFFGYPADPSALVTWSPSTGLSTIASGTSPGGFGSKNMTVDQATGRVYFSNGAYLFSWHSSTGLSTLFNGGGTSLGNDSMLLMSSSTTPRLFFRNGSRYHYWTPATGVSTIVQGSAPGQETALFDTVTGRVYIGDEGTGRSFWTWHPSTGLSTITSSRSFPGHYSIDVYSHATSGRVYFGEQSATGNFYTWSVSNGLSTIVSSRLNPGVGSVAVDPGTGRVFFGEGDGSATGNFYTWHPSTGLSTLVSNRVSPGFNATRMDPGSGRVFFGELATSSAMFYTWHSSTGLSTILSAGKQPGAGQTSIGVDSIGLPGPNIVNWNQPDIVVNSLSGRVYFGENSSSGRFYTWAASTGLSTIAFNRNDPGVENALALDETNERVYFGEAGSSSGSFFTWSPTTGLSTLISGIYNVGSGTTTHFDSGTKRIFFGQEDNATVGVTETIWTWSAPSSSSVSCD
jgi:hypothetical protein